MLIQEVARHIVPVSTIGAGEKFIGNSVRLQRVGVVTAGHVVRELRNLTKGAFGDGFSVMEHIDYASRCDGNTLGLPIATQVYKNNQRVTIVSIGPDGSVCSVPGKTYSPVMLDESDRLARKWEQVFGIITTNGDDQVRRGFSGSPVLNENGAIVGICVGRFPNSSHVLIQPCPGIEVIKYFDSVQVRN